MKSLASKGLSTTSIRWSLLKNQWVFFTIIPNNLLFNELLGVAQEVEAP